MNDTANTVFVCNDNYNVVKIKDKTISELEKKFKCPETKENGDWSGGRSHHRE